MAVPPWIEDIINEAIGPVRRLANAVRDKLAGLLSTLERIFGLIGGGWALLYKRGRSFAGWTREAVLEAYLTLRWIRDVWIPRRLKALQDTLTGWVIASVNSARNLARSLVATLRRWATDYLNRLSNALGALGRWAHDHVEALEARTIATARRVAELLSDPRKLAEWIIAPLVGAAWRYGLRQRDRIGAWFFRTSPSATMWLARQIEGIIGRIL